VHTIKRANVDNWSAPVIQMAIKRNPANWKRRLPALCGGRLCTGRRDRCTAAGHLVKAKAKAALLVTG